LTFSYAAAQAIDEYVELKAKYTRKGLELALFIYRDVNAVLEAAICTAKLGRFTSAIDYVMDNETLSTAEVCLRILHKCPDMDLAMLLVESPVVF
jgi:hypothetical protein